MLAQLEQAIVDRLLPLQHKQLQILNLPEQGIRANFKAQALVFYAGKSPETPSQSKSPYQKLWRYRFSVNLQVIELRLQHSAYPFLEEIASLLEKWNPGVGRLGFFSQDSEDYVSINDGKTWIYSQSFSIPELKRGRNSNT